MRKAVTVLLGMLTALAILLPGSMSSKAAELNGQNNIQPSVSYSAHVQNIGWQNYVSDGATAGTSGQGLRMEALKIKLANSPYSGSIQYRAHVQNIGWQNYVSDDAIAGTSGKSLRVEALQIRLSGDIANYYDVYYRVHAQNYGWLGWTSNGNSAGTLGESLRLEAIEIRLVPKGSAAPGSTANPFYHKMLNATAHVQNIGWQGSVNEGDTAGTTGKTLHVEALKLSLSNPDYSGVIQYKSHIQNIGWEGSWKSNGQISGTTGRNLSIEAVQISLTGEMASHYDIYYRAHVQNIGWMGWASNGAKAGTEGKNLHVEALQVILVNKGGQAPGSTATPFLGNLISYAAHVQNIGWQGDQHDGATAGTTGRALQIEAFRASLTDVSYSGAVQYRSYLQDIGWESDWKQNGQTSGTTGQNRRVEAMELRLTGDAANLYDIYYRTYVANLGWLGWAADGNPAGSKDFSLRIEAFQVCLVTKGAAAPGSTSGAYLQAGVGYSTYEINRGWTAESSNGAVSGTTGQNISLQGLKARILNNDISGSIQYRSHISNVGWENNWTSAGNASGQPGGTQDIEAIEMRLTGDLANKYDLYYRVHSADRGWLGWAKNGESAGTKGYSLAAQAVQIKLVIKGADAPGSTKDAFLDKSRVRVVVLDPGHDSYRPGAHGGNLQEHEVCLKIAKYCKAELQKYGVTVYMTRETNACPAGNAEEGEDNGCLAWRVNYAASKNAEMMISLHLNSSSGSGAHGAEILQQNKSYNVNNVYATSSSLAKNILTQLNGVGITNRGIGNVQRNSEDNEKYPDGSIADYYAILKRAKLKGTPAVIVEHCFISNASDRSNYLSSDAKLQRLGIADAHGILKTMGLM